MTRTTGPDCAVICILINTHARGGTDRHTYIYTYTHTHTYQAWGNLPSLLERLLERPMASALLEELRTLATEVNRSEIEYAVGSS